MGGRGLDWGLGNDGGKEDDKGGKVGTVAEVEGEVDGALNEEDGISDLNLEEKLDMEVLSSNCRARLAAQRRDVGFER